MTALQTITALAEKIDKLEASLINITEQRDELLEALKHLEHNARKSGANMGLALDFAADAIAKATLK